MHYFKRNIGDYHKKAGRLNMLEHGAYTLLLDACYDREQFPTLELAIEWCWARTDEEIAAVKFVLSKFFILINDVFTQNRINEELENYYKNAKINKDIAIKREEAKRTKRDENITERTRLEHEPPPNHKPITINQEPITIKVKPSCAKKQSRTSTLDNGFNEFWNNYPKKVGKDKALIAWVKKKPKIDEVLKALNWQVVSEQWTKQDGQFIPNPTTYINEGRWQDEPQRERNPF